MIQLARFEVFQKKETVEKFQPLIDHLKNCEQKQFLIELSEIQEWDRIRDDLYVWIPVLNRIDETLNSIIEKYGYKQKDSKTNAVKLICMDQEDIEKCVTMMEFTCRLLYNTENRYIYSSMDVMHTLLNSPNFEVKLCAIKILAIMGERYLVSRERIDSENELSNQDLKKKALKLALVLPSSVSDESGDHVTLVDLFTTDKSYPDKWGKLKFSYFIPETSTTSNEKDINHSSRSTSSNMKKFSLTRNDLQSYSLQQIFNKGMEIIPSEYWHDFSLKASIAKAFCDNKESNESLRNLIMRTKFNAVAYINTVYAPPQVSSKLFEIDPYTFNSLSEFISLAEPRIPSKLRLDCLFALECISLKHIWCSDIMRNLGGNLSHGTLFQILRQISTLLRNDNEEISEEYNVRFFYLISNLADVPSLHSSLLSAGLIPCLLDIISVKRSKYRRTLASATHSLEIFINDAESTSEFITNDGFNALINSVNEEIDFGLNNPPYVKPSPYSMEEYTISFRQQAYIRSLLKLVMKLLRTDSGDRIRNLIDSSILVSMRKILENRETFSYTLVTYTLDIIQRVINSEPTIYPVLVEANLIPYIFDHFSEFIAPSKDLLLILPDLLSALCLNVEGLQQVKDKNLVKYLFSMTTDPKFSKLLAWNEESSDFGSSIDELSRHYPDLKEQILDAFCDLIRQIPLSLSFTQPFLYRSTKKQELFYYSNAEEVKENDEGEKELAFWDIQDSSSVIECFSSIFYGMGLENTTLANFTQKMSIQELIPVFDLERPPFDFSASQAMLNITDALQLFDEQDKNYAFSPLLQLLEKKLKNITHFLHHDDSTSFFLSSSKSENEEVLHSIDTMLGELSNLTSLMYIITTVYLNFSSLSPTRLFQITDFFDEQGFSIIKHIGYLFRRCAMEDMYIRNALPDIVKDGITPDDLFNLPPIKIYANDPKQKDVKDNKTAIKFKNTYQTRFMLSKLQTYSAMLFRCFLRLTHTRNADLELSDKSIEIRIFDTTVQQLINMLKIGLTEENISFYLVLLHFNTYVLTYSRTAMTNNDILQTLPAVLFYQKGGYAIYNELVIKLFQFNCDATAVNSNGIDGIYFVKDSPIMLSTSCIINALSLINRSMQTESMETVRNSETYYPFMKGKYNMTLALSSYTKKMALCMIQELCDLYNIFNLKSRSIPYSVYKAVLTVVTNIFRTNEFENNCKLYELKWELIAPSQKNIKILMSAGLSKDAAKAYLEEQDDSLPTERDERVFSEEEWRTLQDVMKTHNHDEPHTESSIQPTLSDDEVVNVRNNFYERYFQDTIFNVLPYYPKLTNSFAQTLIQILSCIRHPLKATAEGILERIIGTEIQDKLLLSSLIHIFAIIINDELILKLCTSLLVKYVSFVGRNLKAEHVNTPWYSKALYAYEIIFVKSTFPLQEDLTPELKVKYPQAPLPSYYHIKEGTKESIFNNIIRVGDISNFYSAVSVTRILLLYGQKENYANAIISSGILAKLLKVIGVYQKYEKINFLEVAYLLLVRRCFESTSVVTKLIQHEMDKSFVTKTLALKSDRKRELGKLLEEKPHVIARNPSIFVNYLSQTTHYTDLDGDNVLWGCTLIRDNDNENGKPKIDVGSHTDSNSDIFTKRTGIIHLLLSQLMAASKKDWLSEPQKIQTNSKKGKIDTEKPDPSRNPVCAYMIFLLKLLVELVTSYKQCKYEFLTYDRRHVYTENPKPRSTALNFFLYEILDNPILDEQDKHESKRRDVISMLARSVIVGFVSSVRDESNDKLDPQNIDPDMAYIRKFTIDIISKALRTMKKSEETLEVNISKIDAWFNIISLMLYSQAPYLRPLVDSNKTDADRYQICKMMIDSGVPITITDCMSVFDINYPFCKKLFNNGVEVLNAINTTRSDFGNLFKIENNEDDDVVEEDSDKEDIPNMFKNSSLGMYDVDDIEDDDDDEDIGDDSLIGDDDDIAFVENDGSGFEVVFSDENIESEGNVSNGYSNDSESEYSIIPEDHEVDSTAGFNIDDVREQLETYDSDSSTSDNIESGEETSAMEDSEGENESEIDVVSIENSDDMDIELSDYSIQGSDWESGLSDLSSISDNSSISEDSDLHEVISRYNNGRRVWSFGDGAELEDESDNESRGVFQGIEHTFNPDLQNLFRVGSGPGSNVNHRRTNRRNPNTTMTAPSLTLLNGGRRNQSNLINPLGPSGLEQNETEITEQLSSIRSGVRPRTNRTHFADVLLSGEIYNDNSVEGIVLKSTILRWRDTYDMFYSTKKYGLYLTHEIINKLFPKSFKYSNDSMKNISTMNLVATSKSEDENSSEISGSDSDNLSHIQDISDHHIEHRNRAIAHEDSEGNILDHEPVYVTIDGTSVDIGGTDIDPEFFNALPDDMRSEVFAQHIGQRRAQSLSNGSNDNDNIHSQFREIDPNFLDALPQTLRNTIVNQEDLITEEMSRENTGNQTSVRAHMDTQANAGHHEQGEETTTIRNDQTEETIGNKKNNKIYFDNLLDRTGIAALMKTVFISQPYIKREMYHELFARLCQSKQNRSDIINLLLLILTEGTSDQSSLERMYNVVNGRACRSNKQQGIPSRQIPPDCTPLVVANQTIEILQNLIDSDNRLKFFFITEHDNLMLNKTLLKTKKENAVKSEKWPIKYLCDLLDRKLITDETVLMDLLTNILQTCTKPLPAVIRNSKITVTKRKFQIPEFSREDFEKIVSIINLDSCNTKVFQQTLNTMYNLSFLEDGLTYFTDLLVENARTVTVSLFRDLDLLSTSRSENSENAYMNSELVQKMTVPSSDQAKLLKILTAVDYLYNHKKRGDGLMITSLADVYNRMQLGSVWGSLSRCLSGFEARKDLGTSATILLPSIESLMVVCKHSNINKNNNYPHHFEDEKKLDFSEIQVENLFFPFTNIHKKLLNQMVRSNPKLMSGPFALLVKNPKILDFDNKRYYFMAKLNVDEKDKPKLPVTVRRNQVFLDSYRSLFFKSNDEIKNSKLEITFKGESGVDAGGLTREWYQVLSRQMFNPDYALFLPIASDKTTFHPNRSSGINPEHLSFFKFIGMIIGKSIRDQCYLDCHFSREVYKNILGKPVSLKDMDSVDPDYYKSLVWILENDITDIIEETYSLEVDDYGEHKIIDLIENGRNIPVTNDDKQNYVQKIIDYKLHKSVQEQMDNFLTGFYTLIPKNLISIFDEQEIELLINGLPDIDADDWKNNTNYVNYTANSREIGYFWRAVRSFDTEERAKLLQFVTGTSKVPFNGFKGLSGVGGVCKFSIHRDYGSTERLPSSHTCFNQLILPAYNSYEILRKSLLHSINEGSEGFGLA
ncbi:hypothetical protein C6P45_001886 [Maudiozyma exigua]|uniref:HECT-type E3 ubiquitin transferase n=1 Tax=Maudiozyma exigua TaxID=34358 RepID=A0A9P6VY76_MAUEX|nr:hypothetical protein C6P45_001886 [Kazachstania exigua]